MCKTFLISGGTFSGSFLKNLGKFKKFPERKIKLPIFGE
jgi:hypothetical protein